MVYRTHQRRANFRHGSTFRSMFTKFLNFVGSIRPIRTAEFIRDVRQIIYSARHTYFAFDENPYYQQDGEIYEYNADMHAKFQKLLKKLRRLKNRGITWVASDVVNDVFADEL